MSMTAHHVRGSRPDAEALPVLKDEANVGCRYATAASFAAVTGCVTALRRMLACGYKSHFMRRMMPAGDADDAVSPLGI